MSRLLLSLGYSALLFAVGVFAGQSVHTDPGLSTLGRQDSHPVDNPSTNAVPSEFESATAPFSTVSSQRSTRVDGTPTSGNSNGTKAAPENLNESQGTSGSSGRQKIRQLIQRIFPDADEETANVWADVYSSMDPSEVEFILEQKRMLSGTLSIRGSHGLDASLWQPTVPTVASSKAATPLAVAVDAVRSNLRGRWSIGFRRTVVLPEIISQNEKQPVSSYEQMRSTMFLCFDAGRMISSPVATHVSLPADDGSLMFQLEGGRLTRRGDFALLPDRRLGLITQVENYALKKLPQIPEEAGEIRITKTGEILFKDAAGESKSLGTLSVVKVNDLAKLTTADGVIFTFDAASDHLHVTPTTPELRTNTLEISNVTSEEEARLLEHLTSLLPNT